MKKNTLFVNHVILLLTFLLLDVYSSHAQSFECGTPTPTTQEYQDFLDDINIGAGTINSTNTVYQIPIHLFIINNDSGTLPVGASGIGAQIYNAITRANIFFDNGMSFYLCDITYINSSLHYNSGDLSSLYSFIHTTQGYADNAITLVLNNSSALPSATYPTTAYRIIRVSGLDGGLLAHELGHFFGLLHTFEGATYCKTVSMSNCIDRRIILLPNCSCNTEEPSILCPTSAGNCSLTGDRVSDTSSDPGTSFCSVSTTPMPCVVTTPGGQTLNYTPPYQNAMSYYAETWNSFSSIQSERMLDAYKNHANRAYLRDSNQPVCEEFTVFAQEGTVERIRYNSSSSTWESDALPEAQMNLRDNLVGDCEKITDNNGEYKVVECLGYLTSTNIDVTVGQVETANTTGTFAANNGITSSDLTKIQQHLLGTVILPKPYAWIAADVNNSGTITNLDQIKIQKIILGTETSFSVPSWRFIPRYYLNNQWGFKTNFDANPFTAVLDWQDATDRGYLVNGTNPSYLDDMDVTEISADLEDAVNWSFYAIKTGDLNFSANVNGSGMRLSSQTNNLVINSHTTIPAGTTFSILVESKMNDPISSYQMGLGFDPDIFELLGTNQGDVRDYSLDNFGLQKTSEGEFRTVWIDKEVRGVSFAGKKTLFKIYCKAKRDINDISHYINLDNNVLKTLFYDNRDNLVDGNVSLTIVNEEVKAYLLGVYPNPTSNDLNFKIKLTKRAAISIVVRDKNGRTIAHNNTYESGEYAPSFQNTTSLATGALNYTISVDGQVLYSGQVIKF